MAQLVHEQRESRIEAKGEKLTFHLSTYSDFTLFHTLKSETGIYSNGLVNFRLLQWWTTVVNESRLQWWTHAVDFCCLEWHKGQSSPVATILIPPQPWGIHALSLRGVCWGSRLASASWSWPWRAAPRRSPLGWSHTWGRHPPSRSAHTESVSVTVDEQFLEIWGFHKMLLF